MQDAGNLQETAGWKRLARHVAVFGGILLALSFVYLPALQAYYAYHDDFYLWAWSRKTFSSFPVYNFLKINCGRPLGAVLLCTYGLLIETVSDANLVRFLTVVNISITGLILYIWLRRHSLNAMHSFLLILSVFALPAYQLIVGWASSAPAATALWPAALAAILAFEAFGRAGRRKLVAGLFVALALALLLASLLTYQPSAMIYWVMLAAFLLVADLEAFRARRRCFYGSVLVGLAAIGIYGAGIRFAPFLKDTSGVHSVYTTAAISTDVVGKLQWFIREPLLNSLNLWSILPSTAMAVIVAMFILAGGLFGLLWAIRHAMRAQSDYRSLLGAAEKGGLVLAMLLLSYMPSLVARSNRGAYRTLVALSPLVVFLLYGALWKWSLLVPIRFRNAVVTAVLLAAGVFAGYQAHYTVMNHIVFPHTVEFMYVKTALGQADLSKVETVHIIRPDGPLFWNGPPRYDEFGGDTTSFWQDIPWIVKCAMNELGMLYYWDRGLKVTNSAKSEFSGADDRTLVIDMTRLQGFNALSWPQQKVPVVVPAGCTEPVLVQEGYQGFNVVACDGIYFGLAQDEGEFILSKARGRGYRRCVSGYTIREVRERIDRLSSAQTRSGSPP